MLVGVKSDSPWFLPQQFSPDLQLGGGDVSITCGHLGYQILSFAVNLACSGFGGFRFPAPRHKRKQYTGISVHAKSIDPDVEIRMIPGLDAPSGLSIRWFVSC